MRLTKFDRENARGTVSVAGAHGKWIVPRRPIGANFRTVIIASYRAWFNARSSPRMDRSLDQGAYGAIVNRARSRRTVS